MQQYFVAGQAQDVVTITDKDTVKHMFKRYASDRR